MNKYYIDLIFYEKKNKRNCKNNTLLNSNILKLKKDDYDYLLKNNVTITDLNNICKNFNLKINGKKDKILYYLYNNLRLLYFKNKIVKLWRNYLYKVIKNTQGPARLKRKICNNPEDFLTTENINEIDPFYFFSYKDTDNFIYGFNLQSIKQLIDKNQYFNPYNRSKISNEILDVVKTRIKYNKFIGYNIQHCIDNENNNIVSNNNTIIKNKTLLLFQYIDTLGYYTDINWFLNLNRSKIIRFIRELYDIWNYRAGLNMITKVQICPWINGNPFININLNLLNNRTLSEETFKLMSLTLIENFIKPNLPSNEGNKSLSAMYILSAITLVSQSAAESLPWLYQSVN